MGKKILLFLLTFAMIGTLVGCGSKANTVSDEDLQMLRDMRDELKAENDSLKGTESNDVVEDADAPEQEDENLTVAENDSEGEPYQIGMALKFRNDSSTPEYIIFRFWVDDNCIYTGDLTKKADADSWMFEGERNAPTYERPHSVKLSPEHINKVRDMFIELYNTQLKEYQDLYYTMGTDINMTSEKIESLEGFPDSFEINVDGKSVNFNNVKWKIGEWSGGGTDTESVYEANFLMMTTTNGLGDFFDYYSSIIAEDAGKEFDYGDYSFIDNVIELYNGIADGADSQDNNTETKEEPKQSSVIGTFWDPTGFNDAEFTFNADGTGQNFSPSTGKVSYTFTYTVDGNKISVKGKHSTDSFTLDGDTLIGVDGKYKRK